MFLQMDEPHNLSNVFRFQTFMDGKMNSISKLFGISLLPLMGKEQLMGLVTLYNAHFGEMSAPLQLPQMMQ